MTYRSDPDRVRLEEVFDQGLDGARKWDPPGPERDAEIVALVADNWTYAAVAVLYDLTPERVYQIVKRERGRRCA